MFVITRAQAKQLRSVLRHTLLPLEPSGEWPFLVVFSNSSRTILQTRKKDLAVPYHTLIAFWTNYSQIVIRFEDVDYTENLARHT